jgi:hypothetical protein
MSEKQSQDSEVASLEATPESLATRFGLHPATTLELELEVAEDRDLGRWLVASILLGGRTPETLALDAFRALDQARLSSPLRLAQAGLGEVQHHLERVGVSHSEAVAALLGRVCARLAQRHAESIDRLAAEADGLEELAGRLAQLGSGFGKAAVFRFLTPLRNRWSAAGDLPTSPAVLAAGQDLGWIPETQDAEGAATSLAAYAAANGGVPVRDLEAGLEKLGRAACLRGRSDRCPLAAACPRKRE